MTGHEFREVDIDLLADFVGGALDGTPDQEVVAALVTADPGWREAHAALVDGMASVGAGLRALGAEPTLMPDDVAVRIDAALAELAPEPASDTRASDTPASAGATPIVPAYGDAVGGRRLTVVPAPAGAHPVRVGATRSRRARRWAAPVAAAAGVLAFAAVGIDYLTDAQDDAGGAQSTAAQSDTAAEQAPMLASAEPGRVPGAGDSRTEGAGALAAVPAPQRITTSGTNFRAGGLPGEPAGSAPSVKVQPRTPDRSRPAATLDRLVDRAALLACLEAIARRNAGGPVSVATVDYAKFEGEPALIVRFTAGNGDWAWAVGPDCGTPGAGADARYLVPVG